MTLKSSQLRLPWTSMPSGVKTSSWRVSATTSSGRASCFHVATESRDATSSAIAPMTANWSWLKKIEYADPESVSLSEVDGRGREHHDEAEADEDVVTPTRT